MSNIAKSVAIGPLNITEVNLPEKLLSIKSIPDFMVTDTEHATALITKRYFVVDCDAGELKKYEHNALMALVGRHFQGDDGQPGARFSRFAHPGGGNISNFTLDVGRENRLGVGSKGLDGYIRVNGAVDIRIGEGNVFGDGPVVTATITHHRTDGNEVSSPFLVFSRIPVNLIAVKNPKALETELAEIVNETFGFKEGTFTIDIKAIKAL